MGATGKVLLPSVICAPPRAFLLLIPDSPRVNGNLINRNMRVVASPARLSRATIKAKHRRYWVFFLLFLFSAIAYLDRVNMSVAGKPIAHEFGLSPIALS